MNAPSIYVQCGPHNIGIDTVKDGKVASISFDNQIINEIKSIKEEVGKIAKDLQQEVEARKKFQDSKEDDWRQ